MDVKILIVDDEVLSAMFFQLQFKKKGYQVLKPVTNGRDAIKSALEERPAFILMDINLAGKMDGIEAADEILKTYKPGIIFITGFRDDEFRNRASLLNPLAFFTKPVKIEQIYETIQV